MSRIVLQVIGADGSRRTARFEGYARISIGADAGCDLVLRVAPRCRATLLVDAASLRVVAGAEAGARIEGEPVAGEALLLPGERLELGSHTLVVEPSDRDTTRPRRRVEPAADRLGRYVLLRSLGGGGMAEVYLAEDTTTGHRVALKCILPALVHDESIRQMFADEGRLAAQLDHPALCRVHEVGSYDGRPYIAMEPLAGADLRRIQRHIPRLRPELAVSVVGVICEALQYLHRLAGADGQPLEVVHRNVVPSNVMVCSDGSVKLLDLGIARACGRLTETPAGVLKGVLSYLAPEMIRGEPFDHRVDVFSAAALLYELVTGVQAFARESGLRTLEAIRNGELVPLRELAPELPVALEQVLLRGLAVDPDERPASAAVLREALGAAVPAARGVGPDQRAALVAALP